MYTCCISQRFAFAALLVAAAAATLATAGPVQRQHCPWGTCEEDEVTFMNLLQVHAATNKTQFIVENHRAKPATSLRTMKKMFPYYHTSAELRQKALDLSKDCGGAMKMSTLSEDGIDIDLVHVRAPDANPTNKVFVLFGEHSRELISPESALRMLEILCGKVEAGGDMPSVPSILLESEFQIVINGNPKSRNLVEDGQFCLRANPNGVDLNRNWDEQWVEGYEGDTMTNPGSKPFSEPETRIFKNLVQTYQPTTFLTVHSGTKGMYMPYAYDLEHMAKYNAPKMLGLLQELDKTHCQCPFGAAGKQVGYACPGTCLDWVYEKLKTPYVFAFEIYASPDQDAPLKERWEELSKSGGMSLLQNGNHLGHEHFAELFDKHGSDFVQRRQQGGATGRDGAHEAECFAMFNPGTEAAYNQTVHNWAVAYLEMAAKIGKDLHEKATNLEKP